MSNSIKIVHNGTKANILTGGGRPSSKWGKFI